jgi:hypothetical protein
MDADDSLPTPANLYEPDLDPRDDGIESNLYGIASQICQQPPQAPCSIQLLGDSSDAGLVDESDYEFEVMSDFTMSCVGILFGAEAIRNLVMLTTEQINLLKDYLRSVGFELCLNTTETDDELTISMSFQHYADGNDLSHLKNYMA